MSPITHFLAGWLFGQTTDLNRRERAAVAVAGMIPDLDGLGLIAELATRHAVHPLTWWSDYHHVLGHNLSQQPTRPRLSQDEARRERHPQGAAIRCLSA